MKTSTLIVLGLLIAVSSGSLFLLRTYQLDLVHTIVVNAVTQKAPQGYPVQRIRKTFSEARSKAEKNNRGERHLEQLLKISQRLEKIQFLTEEGVQELLQRLTRGEEEALSR